MVVPGVWVTIVRATSVDFSFALVCQVTPHLWLLSMLQSPPAIQVFVPPSAESLLIAKHLPWLFRKYQGRGVAHWFHGHIMSCIVAPMTQFSLFSLELNVHLFLVLHTSLTARISHFLMIPVNFFLMAIFAAHACSRLIGGDSNANATIGANAFCCVTASMVQRCGHKRGSSPVGLALASTGVDHLVFGRDGDRCWGLVHGTILRRHLDLSQFLQHGVGPRRRSALSSPIQLHRPVGEPYRVRDTKCLLLCHCRRRHRHLLRDVGLHPPDALQPPHRYVRDGLPAGAMGGAEGLRNTCLEVG